MQAKRVVTSIQASGSAAAAAAAATTSASSPNTSFITSTDGLAPVDHEHTTSVGGNIRSTGASGRIKYWLRGSRGCIVTLVMTMGDGVCLRLGQFLLVSSMHQKQTPQRRPRSAVLPVAANDLICLRIYCIWLSKQRVAPMTKTICGPPCLFIVIMEWF